MYLGEFTLERRETSVLKDGGKICRPALSIGDGAELARSTKTEAEF